MRRRFTFLLLQALALVLVALLLTRAHPDLRPTPLQAAPLDFDHFVYLAHVMRARTMPVIGAFSAP